MITPQEFKERWATDVYPLLSYTESDLKTTGLPEKAVRFLCDAGMPVSAAPFLNFDSPKEGGMKRIAFKVNGVIESGYIKIGFDSSGNIICVKEKSFEVLLIDHEDNQMKCFMNTSIEQLAECLLLYAEFGKLIKKTNGRRAFLEKNATEEQITALREDLTKADSRALEKDSFWELEVSRYR